MSGYVAVVWLGAAAVLCFAPAPAVGAATEQTFPLLQTRTRTYTNVTVMTKATNYIFITHSAGMENIKLADLSPEIREQLGYVVKRKPATNVVVASANQFLAKAGLPPVQEVRKQAIRNWTSYAGANGKVPVLTREIWLGAVGIALLLHIIFSYCCSLICLKAGQPSRIAVWLPVVQLFPLLRAAGMSGWWFLAFLVPLFNLIAQVIWSIKIVRARHKSGWVAFWLLLPLTNLFAFLYLAFSSAPAPRKERRVELMTLETA